MVEGVERGEREVMDRRGLWRGEGKVVVVGEEGLEREVGGMGVGSVVGGEGGRDVLVGMDREFD